MSKRNAIVDHLLSIVAAFVIVFFVRSTVVESFKIPSGSMIPTLFIGDHVLVNKMAYRLPVPFSEYFGEGLSLWDHSLPERGDVVVFKSPRNPEMNYIKRVIGLPGDRIKIRDRLVFVNNQPLAIDQPSAEEKKRIFYSLNDPKLGPDRMSLESETIDQKKHWVFRDETNFVSEAFGPFEVPEGKIFVMGDNRDFSDDSRFIGAIPVQDVKGRALRVWLSIWIQFDPFEFHFRPSRTGSGLVLN